MKKTANKTLWVQKTGALPLVFQTIFCWGETLTRSDGDIAKLMPLIQQALSVLQGSWDK
jgi:hypothetical protein